MTETATTCIAVLSNDEPFCDIVQSAFHTHTALDVAIVPVTGDALTDLAPDRFGLLIADTDLMRGDNAEAVRWAISRFARGGPLLLVTGVLEPEIVRWMVRLKVADLLTKPVGISDLVRAAERAVSGQNEDEVPSARFRSFVPASGGVGNTTLAIQTGFLLMGAERHAPSSTCIVDLNFQTGACADFLDLEPRFQIEEIEHQPDRLDLQLLEVMLSRHSSGLALVAAPSDPAEMRSFDPEMVAHLLDLVSAYFDNVVIDMPRTWFPWTEAVLMGSDEIYLTAEMTVPGIRHAQRMLAAIARKTDNRAKPKVIINRFDGKGGGALMMKDVADVLGDALAGTVSNNYRLVRSAIDRGVPLDVIEQDSAVARDLAGIILPGTTRRTSKPLSAWLAGAMPQAFRRKAA
ncbi:MAG: response regulator receiver protein [Pseudomonadota bacterium]